MDEQIIPSFPLKPKQNRSQNGVKPAAVPAGGLSAAPTACTSAPLSIDPVILHHMFMPLQHTAPPPLSAAVQNAPPISAINGLAVHSMLPPAYAMSAVQVPLSVPVQHLIPAVSGADNLHLPQWAAPSQANPQLRNDEKAHHPYLAAHPINVKTVATHAAVDSVRHPQSAAAKTNTGLSVHEGPGVTPVASPPAQKPRWETPLRKGNWKENWQSASELSENAPSLPHQLAAVSKTVRSCIAEAVVAIVGDHLPRPTVEKWLCLLSEYLELNADEQVLVLCLLRKYVDADGVFIGERDHLRPQKWEKVIAVACYLAVLLSEEFPGRTATDVRELLGPNFRFGSEQVNFLKQVNWRISVSHEFYMETKNVVEADDRTKVLGWFLKAVDLKQRVKRAEPVAAKAKPSAQAISPKVSKADIQTPTMSKKRSIEEVSSPEDGVVPGVKAARSSVGATVPLWAA